MEKYILLIAIIMVGLFGIFVGIYTGTFADSVGIMGGSHTNIYCINEIHPDKSIDSFCHEQGWVKGKWISRNFIKNYSIEINKIKE